LEEYHKLDALNKKEATILVVGAGFIGVEWATELEHFFPNLKLTIIDFLPRCLGPLPDSAAQYCSEYMSASGIKEFYSCKYDPKNPDFWKGIELPDGCDCEYVCIGVKASNYFMPAETLSDKGPGGGGWIHFNKYMQVTKKPTQGGAVWADGTIFAVGDCNYGCIGDPPNFEMHPIPKISYPGEEQALHAVVNLKRIQAATEKGGQAKLQETWWPWGAGMFATSLGPHDACFVMGANHVKGSGYMVNWWIPAALQKEIIETSKIDECKDRWIGILIWHFVHHTPVNLWGKGPWMPSTH
jgi:NADH dehydrogenase FAD-containing subunit